MITFTRLFLVIAFSLIVLGMIAFMLTMNAIHQARRRRRLEQLPVYQEAAALWRRWLRRHWHGIKQVRALVWRSRSRAAQCSLAWPRRGLSPARQPARFAAAACRAILPKGSVRIACISVRGATPIMAFWSMSTTPRAIPVCVAPGPGRAGPALPAA